MAFYLFTFLLFASLTSGYRHNVYVEPNSGVPHYFASQQQWNDLDTAESVYWNVKEPKPPSWKLTESERHGIRVSLVSRCNLTLYRDDIEDSTDYANCFYLGEKLLCSPENEFDKVYRYMLADKVMNYCYHYMNLDSVHALAVKQLYHQQTKVEVFCEKSFPISKCQCKNYLIEQDHVFRTEKRFQDDRMKKTQNDLIACSAVRDSLKLANESGTLQRESLQFRIRELQDDLKQCEKEKEAETTLSIANANNLSNCTSRAERLLNAYSRCKLNLTISRRSLEMCHGNMTTSKQKRQQEYNECDATRIELQSKVAESQPPEVPNASRMDMSLSVKKFLRVVLLRGYWSQIELFGITPALVAHKYTSKYGSSESVIPGIPIAPPRQLLIDVCGVHCAAMKNRKADAPPTLTTKYPFGDLDKSKPGPRFASPTGFSLYVEGDINIWKYISRIDSDNYHIGFFKNKKTVFFALRGDGNNFEFCACPTYSSNFDTEIENFLDSMSSQDKALITGAEHGEKPEETASRFWQRHQQQGHEAGREKYPQHLPRRGSQQGYPYFQRPVGQNMKRHNAPTLPQQPISYHVQHNRDKGPGGDKFGVHRKRQYG